MTTKNPETIDLEHEDELIVHHLLPELIQNERWELTELGRLRLQADQQNHHQHQLVIWPFGKEGEPSDCVDHMHMRSDGQAVWRCECGYRICRDCFEVPSRRYVISVVDQR